MNLIPNEITDIITVQQELSNSYLGRTFLGVEKSTFKQLIVRYIPQSSFGCEKVQNKMLEKFNLLRLYDLPFIVTFSIIQKTNDHFIFIRPYINKTSLGDMIKELSPFSDEISLRIYRQIISSLMELHKLGFSPNSLHPNNIFFDSSNQIIITDLFELIPDLFLETQTPDRFRIGFLPPEFLDKSFELSTFSDVWIVTVILYLMVKGIFPWSTHNVCKMIQEIIFTPHVSLSDCQNISIEIQKIFSSVFVHDPRRRPNLDVLLSEEKILTFCKIHHFPTFSKSGVICEKYCPLPNLMTRKNPTSLRKPLLPNLTPIQGHFSVRKRIGSDRSLTIPTNV